MRGLQPLAARTCRRTINGAMAMATCRFGRPRVVTLYIRVHLVTTTTGEEASLSPLAGRGTEGEGFANCNAPLVNSVMMPPLPSPLLPRRRGRSMPHHGGSDKMHPVYSVNGL